ncbi:MAG TPA: aspartyl/asparaginyl beta-hydroxylase domain-containing protein [Steroidobacteraceae bacterium]|nr:aspartyl/asparaginyl beta-hydroxylase domain-containing protein [Steroidobacteraceae bacterium]
MTVGLVILCICAGVALAAYLGRGLGAAAGNRTRKWAASIFVRAEARGVFRKLSGFDRNFLEEYPALRILEDNYQIVREECLALLAERVELPRMHTLSATYTSGGIHTIAWKTFMFKSGKFIRENCALAPRTAALLRQIPGVYTAFFSILEPHQHIKPHWGYWKGFVRYHLGVVIPDNNRNQLCWLRVNSRVQDRSRPEEIENGEKYYWKDGVSVMFDDTFLHDAANESDEVRVVFWLDVARRMPWHFSLLNKLFIAIGHMDASVRRIRTNARVTVPRPNAN